jgi:hypothetical protein
MAKAIMMIRRSSQRDEPLRPAGAVQPEDVDIFSF